MDYDDMAGLPGEVAETLRAFAQYLMGRGPVPDVDGLDDDARALVDELLPAIVDLVGERVVPADPISGSGDRPRDVGRGPVPGGGAHVDGGRLRAARNALGLSTQDVATQVSRHGKTIGTAMLDTLEDAVDTVVDDDLVAALAEVLEITSDDLTPEAHSLARAVIDEIRWAHPTAEVRYDDVPLAAESEPLVRLVISDLGLLARVLVFDVGEEIDLRQGDKLAIAATLSAAEPATHAFLLVAGADPERATQIVDSADLREGFLIPGGERLRGPRRLTVVLEDAIRYVFQELNATWADDVLGWRAESDLDNTALAEACAESAIAVATRTRPRIEAKREALAGIGDSEIAGLARLLAEVQEGRIAAGSDFRERFDDDLVGAA